MSTATRAACLQFTPGNDLQHNLRTIEKLVQAAAAQGATLVALPEFATYLDRSSASMRSSASTQANSVALKQLQRLAQASNVWMLIGSLVLFQEDDPDGKLMNRSFLLAPDGAVWGRYDKIHLFDARLSDGRVVGESRHYGPGKTAVVAQAPFGNVGMTICYDLRFPHLYRQLAQGGAEILMVPAAFAAETGKAHWEALIRARAIENGCYLLAPATCGVHPGDWETYGHASIVDPWGNIIAACDGAEEGFAIADLDVSRVADVRSRIPSLATNPTFAVVECLGASK